MLNLNNLIKKIININTENNVKKFDKMFLKSNVAVISISSFILFSLFLYEENNVSIVILFLFSILLSLFVWLFFFSSFFIPFCILELLSKYNYDYPSKLILNIKLFINKIKLSKEEKDIIYQHKDLHNFMFNQESKEKLIQYIFKEYIESITNKELEEFLFFLKDNYIEKGYIKIFDKFVENQNLFGIFFNEYNNFSNQLSDKELIIFKFLNNENKIKKELEIYYESNIYHTSSLNDIISNNRYKKSLSVEQIGCKLIEKYSLKDIIDSIFLNDKTKDNQQIEIKDLMNSIEPECKILLKKFIIETILNTKDKDIIKDCEEEFLNYASELDIKNKHLLILMKEICEFKKEKFENKFNIVHI